MSEKLEIISEKIIKLEDEITNKTLMFGITYSQFIKDYPQYSPKKTLKPKKSKKETEK